MRKCNYSVITLPALEGLPDSVFVEDAALLLPEGAISLPLGTISRLEESESIRRELESHCNVTTIGADVKIEGGDVLKIGKKLFTGVTSRTNAEGAAALACIVSKWGYDVITVPVAGSLHLKTAVTSVDERTVLMNPDWVSAEPFEGLEVIDVDEKEPFAANVLRIGKKLLVHAGFPKTAGRLRNAGFEVVETDISEFLKAEAGMTCLCLLID